MSQCRHSGISCQPGDICFHAAVCVSGRCSDPPSPSPAGILQLRIGGILPLSAPAGAQRQPVPWRAGRRYADRALALLLHRCARQKPIPAEYEIKMFGGGNVNFPTSRGGLCSMSVNAISVPAHSVAATRVAVQGIRRRRGGTPARRADLASGDVWVRQVGMDDGDAQTLPCQQCRRASCCHLAYLLKRRRGLLQAL